MDQENHVIIRTYTPQDEDVLFALIKGEGEEWKDYWDDAGKPKYRKALQTSVTYLIFAKEKLCGYARCRHDDGFGIYVYDLLVDKAHRGKAYGRLLLEAVCGDYPQEPTYVMSDVDPYYQKLNYAREGSIFIVHTQ